MVDLFDKTQNRKITLSLKILGCDWMIAKCTDGISQIGMHPCPKLTKDSLSGLGCISGIL